MNKKFEVSYSLPYRHYVTIGVEANDAAAAVQRVRDAFYVGTLWDTVPDMPLLGDEYCEDGHTAEPLAFECTEVEALIERASIVAERRAQAAQHACAALLEAFANRAQSDLVAWGDIEAAYALALQACGKEPAGHAGADPKPLPTHSGIGAPANPGAHDEVAVGTSGRLVTLEGEAIQGTLETVAGIAGIASAVRNEDGSLDCDCAGGTRILWEELRTVTTPAGEPIFVTEDGDEVPASRVKLVSED